MVEDGILYLVFVANKGKTVDNKFSYEFIFSREKDFVYNDEWYEPIANLCSDLEPIGDALERVKVESDIPFDVVQDCMCFGMIDAINGIVALCWENIDYYEEYPEDGRLIFKFGDTIDEIAINFKKRGVEIIPTT